MKEEHHQHQSPKAAQESEPREEFLTIPITRYEFDIIVNHHRDMVFGYAVESIAWRQYSSSGYLRMAHAFDRLQAIDPEKLQALEAEIEAKRPEWETYADEMDEREQLQAEQREQPPLDGCIEWAEV